MKTKKITWFRKLCYYEVEGICYYPEYCRFWKTCHRKGTSFLHGWIMKMLTLEKQLTEPRKNRDLLSFCKEAKIHSKTGEAINSTPQKNN